ncbi:MAG TPA: FtsX-like permease family protein [Steroidobacteraceae bacterium]
MVRRALDRKLWRDLWRMRGQVLAIALIMASGIGVLITGLTNVEALDETARAYYERYRFADIFAQVKRAPKRVAAQIADLPGVQTVETRVAMYAVLEIAGFEEPVVGRLVSVPANGAGLLNRLALRAGRLPHARASTEAVVSEPFAQAHNLLVGSRFRAILNGTWRELTVVGIALSPEYVYAIGPGALMPDDARFGVVWMDEETLQAAFDLDGAFNDLSIALLRGADVEATIEAVDRILERYGGVGAYSRDDQISNWFLMNEIAQLRRLAHILPTIFLAVAAFLTNMVLARLIALERSEIGLLKAFGYGKREIAWHYTKFVVVIGAVGVLLGWIASYVLGRYNTQLYAQFFHFPFLVYRPGPTPFVLGLIIGVGAALAGAWRSVRNAANLAPAQAMLPPAPPMFRRTRLSQVGWLANIEQLTRIILRQVGRWPMRSFTTCAGIAMAVAVLIVALQWIDATDHMVNVYFREAQSQDVSVSFAEPRSTEVVRDLSRLPGVMVAEPMLFAPAKLRFGSREERESLQGLPAEQQLYRVFDASGRALRLSDDGLMISTMLAELLGVQRGDRITVELLTGRRDTFTIPVSGTFETYLGSPAYIELGALARLLKERPTASSVHLRVDPVQLPTLLRELTKLPRLSSITLKSAAIVTFNETMAETILIFVSFFIAFSCALAFGVTYNAARIALSERGRELATLRVLGFTRAEISYLLLGEIAFLALLALPLGCLVGRAMAQLIIVAFKTELFRVPFVIDPSTYAWAMITALLATAASAILVRRRLDRLDLIGVLKTRE